MVAPIAKTLGVVVTLCHHLYTCSGTQSRRTAISLGDIRCDAPVLLDDKTRMRCNLGLSLHNAKLPESKRAKRNRSSSASTATFLGFHRNHPSSTKNVPLNPLQISYPNENGFLNHVVVGNSRCGHLKRPDAAKTDCYELETSAGGSSFHNLCSFFNISTEKPF